MLCISQQMFGQTGTHNTQLEIGFTSGIDFFDLSETFVPRDMPTCVEGCWISGSKPSLSFSIGFRARLKLTDWLRLSSGISYSRNSYYEEFTGSTGADFYTNLTKRTFNFLNVPLLANISLYSFQGKSFALFGKFGFINHINMTKSFPDPESDIELNRYGLSGTVGAGIRFLKGRYIFEVGPYFTHSLTSFGNEVTSDDPAHPNMPSEFKPSSMGINISAFIKL